MADVKIHIVGATNKSFLKNVPRDGGKTFVLKRTIEFCDSDAIEKRVNMSSRTLRRDVLGIGTANAIDYALQFFLPVIVARTLSPEDFAGYRMVWLVVGTLMAFATLQVPQSLSYFLPRLKKDERAPYIVGAVCILTVLATISSAVVNPWFPLLPVEWVQISGPVWFYSVFVFLWIIGSLIDWLPVGDGRAVWQAGLIITLSISRVFSVSSIAWLTGSLEAVLQVLIIFAVLKVSLLGFYILKFHKLTRVFPRDSIIKQVGYTWSFGVACGLYSMRRQAELWLIAAMFTAREFASFSLGAVAAPLFGLIRRSVNNVAFPNLSALNANEDKKGFADLNRKATSTVAFILVPVAVFLWMLADEVITLVYTKNYVDAADIMRVYLFGVIPQVFESSALLRVAGLGRVALKIDLMMLPLVVSLSYVGIIFAGLPGGAIGSVAALFVGHFMAVWKGASRLGIPIADLYDFEQLGWIFGVGLLSGVTGYVSTSVAELSWDISRIIIGSGLMVVSYILFMGLLNRIPAPLVNIFRK